MKTERRQELKTNDLAQMIDDGREFFRKWGSFVVGGVAVIVLVVAFALYQTRAAEQELDDAWRSLSEIQLKSFFTQSGQKRTDAEISMGFEGLQELAAETKDPGLAFETLASQTMIAMRLSRMGQGGVDPRYLDTAEQACNALKDQLPDDVLAVATALNGLINVEADRFVLDGDPSRKEKARELLETLRDDSRFANTPFQTAALERLNRLDEVFRWTVLAPAPAPAPKPALKPLVPLDGPPLPPVSPTGRSANVKKIPAPAPAKQPEEPADTAPEANEEADVPPAASEDTAEPESDEKGSE